MCVLYYLLHHYYIGLYIQLTAAAAIHTHTHTQPYFHRYFDKAMLLLGFARCDEVITNNINCYCEWYFIYLCLPMCCWLFSSSPQQTHLTHARTKVYTYVCVCFPYICIFKVYIKNIPECWEASCTTMYGKAHIFVPNNGLYFILHSTKNLLIYYKIIKGSI